MDIVVSALLLGIMGSFHCAGMCGPLALGIPLYGNSFPVKVVSGLVYNLGRVVTYAAMGLVFGILGKGLSLAGLQQWVSVLAGSFMVLTVLLPLFVTVPGLKWLPDLGPHLRRWMSYFFKHRSVGGLFVIGLINGLLPCGLVYLAIAGAIATTGAWHGALFMALFGLATIPMMLFIALMGSLLSLKVRKNINRVIPYIVVLVGLLFILRGLSLGIPFLSPPASKLTPNRSVMVQPSTTHQQVKGSCCHPQTDTLHVE